MSGAVMLLPNPRKARRAAKRGPRKMSALQRKYFGKRRGRKARKARTGGRRKRARETVIIAQTNPRSSMSKKRRGRSHSKKRRFARNPRRMRTYLRNPIDSGMIQSSLVGAAIGAAGALGVDLAVGNLPIPKSLKSSAISLALVRIAGALAVGWAVGAMSGDDAMGEEAAAGAMTVTAYQLIKNYMTTNYPNLKLARYVPVGRYLGRGRGRGMGLVRRRMRLGAMRRRRMLNGMPGRILRRRPAGVPKLGGVTRMRIPRTGSGRLGYIGPARTLGRYINQR